jgi:hypothetical protein
MSPGSFSMAISQCLLWVAVILSTQTSTAPVPLPSAQTTALVTLRRQIFDGDTGTSKSYCMVVSLDGTFRLTLRTQRLPNPIATVQKYVGVLNPVQAERLQKLVNSYGMRALPPFVEPDLPMDITSYDAFSAKIARGEETDVVGYLSWQGGRPEAPSQFCPN